MTIAQALRHKNVLIREINSLQEKIDKYNSYSTEECPFPLANTEERLELATQELIDVKVAITKANIPVYGKIYELSELKSSIKTWKNVPTIEGEISQPSYRSRLEVTGTYKTYFSVSEIDSKIKAKEERINKLHAELEEFNSTTSIE